MNYLLDTCVISEVIRPKPKQKIINWLRSRDENDLYLSVLTIGEIYKGIEKLGDSDRRKKIQLWVEHELMRRFGDRILPVNSQVAMVWGQIQAQAEKRGWAMPTVDGLIAATGLAFNMVVVTRNVSDMEASGAVLVNPWE